MIIAQNAVHPSILLVMTGQSLAVSALASRPRSNDVIPSAKLEREINSPPRFWFVPGPNSGKLQYSIAEHFQSEVART